MEQKNLRVQNRGWEMPNMNKLFLTCNSNVKNELRFAKMLKWVKGMARYSMLVPKGYIYGSMRQKFCLTLSLMESKIEEELIVLATSTT